jgi:hypothetical protein
MNERRTRFGSRKFRIRLGLVILVLGLMIFILGAKPALFGMDRSPVLGFVQIAVFLIGLALVCIGGYFTLNALWNGKQKTIAADIGLRLVSTGFVIALFAGMADVFGLGSQPFPAIPYFGPWQSTGVIIGELVIVVGFILLVPFQD